MKEQSSFREGAKFSRRILCSRQRIIRSPLPNEHPVFCFQSLKPQVNQTKQEVSVSFSKESGKKIIDPGN